MLPYQFNISRVSQSTPRTAEAILQQLEETARQEVVAYHRLDHHVLGGDRVAVDRTVGVRCVGGRLYYELADDWGNPQWASRERVLRAIADALMRRRICGRCGGPLARDWEDVVCLSCGLRVLPYPPAPDDWEPRRGRGPAHERVGI